MSNLIPGKLYKLIFPNKMFTLVPKGHAHAEPSIFIKMDINADYVKLTFLSKNKFHVFTGNYYEKDTIQLQFMELNL